MSRILVTVALLKPFWKAARDFLLPLFQPNGGSLSALNIYMLLFKGLPESTLVCAISETPVYVLSPSLVSCALRRPVILNGATLISRIPIFPCIFLEVKPINMVPGQPG